MESIPMRFPDASSTGNAFTPIFSSPLCAILRRFAASFSVLSGPRDTPAKGSSIL
ncbi:MAG: hypothetical protein WA126_10260 [Thermodesulfovibrionales bacterium]